MILQRSGAFRYWVRIHQLPALHAEVIERIDQRIETFYFPGFVSKPVVLEGGSFFTILDVDRDFVTEHDPFSFYLAILLYFGSILRKGRQACDRE